MKNTKPQRGTIDFSIMFFIAFVFVFTLISSRAHLSLGLTFAIIAGVALLALLYAFIREKKWLAKEKIRIQQDLEKSLAELGVTLEK